MKVKTKLVLGLVVVLAFSIPLAGCAKKQTPVPAPEKKPETKPALTEITVYYDASTESAYRVAPEKREVTPGDLPMKAMQELVKGPTSGSGLKPILPPDTTVLSVDVKDGIAYPNFEKDFPKKLNVGSGYEAVVVAAIVNTLTELEGIDKVQILVDGKKVDTLAGHVAIDKPLERNEQMIKKD